MSCEDWPACGHEQGCCPDFDEYGNQMNMRCVCGARLSIDSRYSLCDSCLNAEEMPDGTYRPRSRPMTALPPDFDCRDCDYFEDCEEDDFENCHYGVPDDSWQGHEEWVHNPGSEEDWQTAYWRRRALRAERQLR